MTSTDALQVVPTVILAPNSRGFGHSTAGDVAPHSTKEKIITFVMIAAGRVKRAPKENGVHYTREEGYKL